MGTPTAVMASIVSLTVAITMLFRRPMRPLHIFFSAFTLALFFWHSTSMFVSVADSAIADRLQMVAALFLVPTAILFFNEMVRQQHRTIRRDLRIALTLLVVFAAFVFSPWGTWFPVRALVTLYVVMGLGWVLHTLFLKQRQARLRSERERLSYLLYGGLGAWMLGIGEVAPDSAMLAALGHVASTFYVYFLYQSILLRRVIDLVEFLGKAAVLGFLAVVLALVYALLLLWVGPQRQGLWLFNTLIASFVILIVYDQVRARVEQDTAKLFFRRHYELSRAVRHLLRTLRTVISLDEMCEHVLSALHDPQDNVHVAIYLATEGELEFQKKGARGMEPPSALSIRQQPSLLQELQKEKRPLVLESIEQQGQDYSSALTTVDSSMQREYARMAETATSMRKMGAQVVIPMLSHDRMVGLLMLGTKHDASVFSTEEIALLLSVAEACAILMDKSQEYEQLRERDRLVAVGEMAAGMAHEIKNPLGAIKGAAQCLEPEFLPKEANELVHIIVEEVDRLNRVLTEFLEYARPYHGNPVPTNVNDVIRATHRILQQKSIPQNIQVHKDLDDNLALAMIDPEQFKQVLLNLILNAMDAMPKGGTLTLRSFATHAFADAPAHSFQGARKNQILVQVQDTGEGIEAENLSRVFIPFFTTKPNGTGLGLAISHRIVRNTGGQMQLVSRAGQGSVFTVSLPAAFLDQDVQSGASQDNTLDDTLPEVVQA